MLFKNFFVLLLFWIFFPITTKLILPEFSFLDGFIFTLISFGCLCAKSLQSCPTLCNPMDYSPPGAFVQGILQAGILEWVAMPSFRGSSQPRDWTCISYVSCVGRWVLHYLHHLDNSKLKWKSLSLYDPMDCRVLGILQATILEWVAFLFSRGSSQPRNRSQVSYIAGGFFTNWAIREAQIEYTVKVLVV